MTLTDDLARSFFDLWHHLDPVEASRFDPHGPPLTLTGFDPQSVEQHGAALRALAGAAEALEPQTLEDEIDQTLLLDAIRGVGRTFAPDSRRLADPAFWLSRLCETLAARPGDETVLVEVPRWTAEATTAWRRATRPAAETGAALLDWAIKELDTEAWTRAAAQPLTAARGELRALAEALAPGARPDVPAPVAGEEEVSWRLHYEYTLSPGAAEALRSVGRLAAEVVGRLEAAAAGLGPGVDWRDVAARTMPSPHAAVAAEPWPSFRVLIGPAAMVRIAPGGALGPSGIRVSAARPEQDSVVTDVRYGEAGGGGLLAARAGARSEIRRRFARPALVDAWGLFIQSSVARFTGDPELAVHLLADLYRRVLVAAADLALHRGQLEPADALAGLADRLPIGRAELEAEVRGVALRPAEAAGAVLVARDWDRLAARWPGGYGALTAAVLAEGLATPVLLRWRHGVDA